MIKKMKFAIDGEDLFFDGITNEKRWNGFHCPYFDLETAKKVLLIQDSKENCLENYCSFYEFNSDNSAIVQTHEDGTETYEPITFEGKLYFPIGYMNWVWVEYVEEETENDNLENAILNSLKNNGVSDDFIKNNFIFCKI